MIVRYVEIRFENITALKNRILIFRMIFVNYAKIG